MVKRPEIPKHYPFGLSNKDLQKAITSFAGKLEDQANSDQYSFGPDFWLKMHQLGQNEWNLRIQERFSEATKRLNKITIGLALVTILLAVTTIWFSKRDMESDQTWRDDQMTELKKNNELLQEQIRINEDLSEKIDEILEKSEILTKPVLD